MLPGSSALIVSNGEQVTLALRKVLYEAGLHVRLAGSCSEAREILTRSNAPAVMFSDTLLPDGTWLDILDLAKETEHEVPVIVISHLVDISLYLKALDECAADFIVSPFYHQDITHILKCAARKGLAIQGAAAA